MSHIKVGILRGGKGSEYDLSMAMGARIITMLRSEPYCREYEPVDILIDQEGVWHIKGFPVLPEKALRHVDVVFNALHGKYGGDGRIQHILETFNMPFTGSKAAGTILAQDKKFTRDALKKAGIKTPYAKDLHINVGEEIEPIAYDLFRSFPMPVVVKPRNLNASVGVTVAKNFDELVKGIDHARIFSPDIIVEEYITGKEIISGFIDDYRNQSHYDLMPIQIKPDVNPHADSIPSKYIDHTPVFKYEDKLSGNYAHTVPADITEDEKKLIVDIVKAAKEHLDMRHLGTVDVIVTPKRGIYVLDVNTHPHFHDHAPFLKSLEAVGGNEKELIAHLIKLALGSK